MALNCILGSSWGLRRSLGDSRGMWEWPSGLNHGPVPLTSAGLVLLLSIWYSCVRDKILFETIVVCCQNMWPSVIYFTLPLLYKENTPNAHRIYAPSCFGIFVIGPAQHWVPTSPSDADTFFFPGECDGVCVHNSHCTQRCPPDTQGNMGFLCRQKKWHKITDTCRTLDAFNIFEVIFTCKVKPQISDAYCTQ